MTNYDQIHVNSSYMSFLSQNNVNYLIRNIVEYDSCIKLQTECAINKLDTNFFGVYFILFNVYKKYDIANLDVYFITIPFFTSNNSINIFDKVKSLESEILKNYQDDISVYGILE